MDVMHKCKPIHHQQILFFFNQTHQYIQMKPNITSTGEGTGSKIINKGTIIMSYIKVHLSSPRLTKKGEHQISKDNGERNNL